MKMREGLVLRKIADLDVVIPIGNNIADFNGIISLNETAAFLWKRLTLKEDLPQIVDALIEEYDVNPEVARKDIELFIEQLTQANIVTA
ncbi:MAG: pqqD [Herbinix sp.]|nr:pqqD [Herbinix sp.]